LVSLVLIYKYVVYFRRFLTTFHIHPEDGGNMILQIWHGYPTSQHGEIKQKTTTWIMLWQVTQ